MPCTNIDFARLEASLNSKYYCFYVYAQEKTTSCTEFLNFALLNYHGIALDNNYAGSIYQNGLLVTPTSELQAPCILEFYQIKPDYLVKPSTTFDPHQHILFDENGLVVVFKPAGIHTYPAKEHQEQSLYQSLSAYYNCNIHIPSRLDFSTSGLILLSRNTASHDYAQNLYEKRWIEKTYYFETHNKPQENIIRIDKPIGRNPRHPVLRQVLEKFGRNAITDFTLLENINSDSWLIEAKPFTGRTHQIRVHAACYGCPVKGDNFYNGALSPYLHLMSYNLQFPMYKSTTRASVKVPVALLPEWARKFTIFANAQQNK